MDAFLGALEATALASALRGSRWLYAALNATHILGVALLVGAVAPLDLRLLGAWPGVPRVVIARVLVPMAAAGLALAIAKGLLLVSVRAREYAALPVLQAKLALVATGSLAALALHATAGARLDRAGPRRLAVHGLVSLTCWLGALACGRLIAFAA